MKEKIVPLEKLQQHTKNLRASGKKLVATNGCFDLLHVGHVRYLKSARALGDALIVGINGDRSVRELKGEEIVPEIHSSLNLGLDIRIPNDYIADENQRLRAYRQIANAHDAAARERAEKELEDRYGTVPEAVRNLLAYSALKTMAEQIGVEAIDRRHNLLNIKFHTATRVDPARLMNLVGKTRGAQFTPAGVLLLPLDGQTAAGDILRFLGEKLEQLRVS